MNCERVFMVCFTPGVHPEVTEEVWDVAADDALAAIEAVKKCTAAMVKMTGQPFRVLYSQPLRDSEGRQLWVYMPAISTPAAGEPDLPHEVNAEGEKVITSTELLKQFPNGLYPPLASVPAAEIAAPAGPGLVSGGARPDMVPPPEPATR